MVLRKLAVALLSVGVMLPGLGHALAVKDVQTKSALGEPFHAEVELVEIGDLNADEIKVTLATQEDFERLGIDRVFFLNDLNFEVVLNQSGRSFIRIRSSKPVREPYLDFVVRIAWPGNLRLQEVTALLDPPLVSDTVPADVMRAVTRADEVEKAQPPVVAPATPPAVESQPLAETRPVQQPPKPELPPAKPSRPVAERPPVRQPEPVPQPDGYRVRAGDTMWKVAEQLRPSADVSVTQTMIAIQRANPSAFIDNNINQLRSGQVLRVPSEAQIREVSAQEAALSLREQANAWRSRAPAVEKPALEAPQVSAVAPVERKPAAVESRPEMKLLAAQTGKPGTAAAGKDQASSVSATEARKLDENRLKADAAKAEKEKAAAKVGALDSKVKANDQQLEVQNAKLAELQAKLKAQQEAAAAAAAAKPAAPAPVATAPAAPTTPAQPQPSPEAAATPAPTPDGVETEGAEVAPELAATPLPEPAAPAKAAPVVVEQSPVDESSPLPLIAGGAGLLALLGGAFFFLKRRRDQKAEEEALAELEAMDAGDAALDDMPSAGFAFGDERRGEEGGLAGALAGAADEAAENDFPSLDDDIAPAVQDRVLADPLEEVEQYLAFERYPQAAGFLSKAIAAAPERADLRLKLLEVYARLDDHNGFAEQLAWFENAGDLDALGRAEELKAGMSPVPVAKVEKDYLDYEPASASAAAADDDLPSLEDLEMDFNATVSASSPSLVAVKDESFDTSLDLSDDFSLDAPAAAPAAAADSGLSLDEELDFSLDAPAEAPAAAAEEALSFELDDAAFDSKPAASDDGLDFTLDELAVAATPASSGLGELALDDFDAPAAPVSAEPVASADDDLSFSLDDLEASAAAAPDSLEGDFSLDETLASAAGDFSFDDTLATAGIGDAAADFDATLKADAAPVAAAPAAAPAAAAADLDMDDEFDFLADTDENATKLDLARAYIDMGDMEGARDILQEVLNEGNVTQKDEAKGLLAQVG